MWDAQDARRLFPDTKWELLDFQNMSISYPNQPGAVENTLQYVVRKLGA
jgi:hypothetical protein